MLLVLRWPDDPRGTDLAGTFDYCRDRDRLVGPDCGGDIAEIWITLLADRLDQDVDNSAAGQADTEGGIVADAVPLKHRHAGRDHIGRQFVDRSLDAASRYAAHHFADRRHGHRRSGFPRRAAERPHHGGQAECLIAIPPLDDLVEDVSHRRSPALSYTENPKFRRLQRLKPSKLRTRNSAYDGPQWFSDSRARAPAGVSGRRHGAESAA